MRPAMLLTLVGAWLLMTGLTEPLPAAQSVRRTQGSWGGQAVVSSSKATLLRIEGDWQTSREEAFRKALEAAQEQVLAHLREQGWRVETRPTLQDVQTKMLRNQQEEERTFDNDVGRLRRFVLEVQITPEVRDHLLKQDRELRTQQRMLWLGKVLSGLVIFLAAAAIYFRLDEWTKGYYSTWLTVAAAGIILASLVVLLSA